jgi:predicted PurR-regulated permease PerM
MTAILLWAVFIAFFLLVVLAPVARWFARRRRHEPVRRGVHPMQE